MKAVALALSLLATAALAQDAAPTTPAMQELSPGVFQIGKMRLDKNKKIWCGAGPSSNKQEIHMYALNTTSTDPGDGYKFFIHKMSDVNGVKTVVLESVQYPGYYVSITSPGSQFAQNLVTLQKASSPEKATGWQCR